jgi:hypothetical protein
MNKITAIIEQLKSKTPFALARFNDGEVIAMAQPGATVARGDQYAYEDLSIALYRALTHKQDNYWVGLPCSVCWPQYSEAVKRVLTEDYDYYTSAVVLTNRNWKTAIEEIPPLLKDRHVTWIAGKGQNTKELTFKVHTQWEVPVQNAWRDYERMNSLLGLIPMNEVVMLSCGPMSRVLSQEWFALRPDLTIIDAGSTWDPFTRDVWHRCHKGNLPPCSECN